MTPKYTVILALVDIYITTPDLASECGTYGPPPVRSIGISSSRCEPTHCEPPRCEPPHKLQTADADLHFRIWETRTFHLVDLVVDVDVLDAAPVHGPVGVAGDDKG
jgi:hypothetical protein